MRKPWPNEGLLRKTKRKNSYKHFLEALNTLNDEGVLIFMDPCNVDASV
jgi:hypothetical protein